MDRKKLIMTVIALAAVLAVCVLVVLMMNSCQPDGPADTQPSDTQTATTGETIDPGSVEIPLPNEDDGEDDVPNSTSSTETTAAADDEDDVPDSTGSTETTAAADGEDDVPNSTSSTETTAAADDEDDVPDSTENEGNTGNEGSTGNEGNTGNEGGAEADDDSGLYIGTLPSDALVVDADEVINP